MAKFNFLVLLAAGILPVALASGEDLACAVRGGSACASAPGAPEPDEAALLQVGLGVRHKAGTPKAPNVEKTAAAVANMHMETGLKADSRTPGKARPNMHAQIKPAADYSGMLGKGVARAPGLMQGKVSKMAHGKKAHGKKAVATSKVKVRLADEGHTVDHRLYAAHEAALNVVNSPNSDAAAAAQRILTSVSNGGSFEDLDIQDVEEVEAEHALQGQTAETAMANGELLTANDIAEQGGGVAGEDVGTAGSYQGDMVPGSQAQLQLFQEIASGKKGKNVAAGNPWDGAQVKYCFAPDVPHNIRHVMEVAMAQFVRAVPCMSWEDVGHLSGSSTSSEEDQRCNSGPAIFIMSNPDSGCYSYVGKLSGESQQLQMNADGCASVGTAIHELGHALGMAHEQSRPDRDQYVQIHWDNIRQGKEGNFELESDAYADIDYDFLSVMHYSAFAFANRSDQPTITRTGSGGSGHDGIGQRSGLSSYDVRQMEVMYREVNPACAANPLSGMGCVDEPDDNGNDICTGITSCGGQAMARCCACGGGTTVQCYEGSACPQTPRLPPGPEADCVQADLDDGTCWVTRSRSCDQDTKYFFKCDSMSCVHSVDSNDWWSFSCGGEEQTEICNAPQNCQVWTDAPVSTAAPTTAAPTTAPPPASTTPAQTTPTSALSPDATQAPWQVAEGPCVMTADNCVTSPNFPSNYGNGEYCLISVDPSRIGSVTADPFQTEATYDKLFINGTGYHGSNGPVNVVPTSDISWSSDGSVTASGWRLCPDAATNTMPPPPTTPAPTQAPPPASTTQAPTTPTTTSATQAPWQVVEGPCAMTADNCVTSPNFPSNYGNGEYCLISVDPSRIGSVTADPFQTEATYDKLFINNVGYHGSNGPMNVVPTSNISWSSDGSVTASGWRLCPT